MKTEFGPLEFGVDTFGDVTAGADGRLLSQAQVIRDVVEEGVLADQVGLDHFGVGEHHRDDFAVSAPEIVLAAVAARTRTVRLGSAVTVLSSDDPVRVYQRFATLDAVSGGRAEMTVGRGSFTESFGLFGHDLTDYETLFEEKLGLLAALRTDAPVTWTGSVRRGLDGVQVYPTTESGGVPVWVGVGGSPESVVRAARHGMPMMLAIIGGSPAGSARTPGSTGTPSSGTDSPSCPWACTRAGSSPRPTRPPGSGTTPTTSPASTGSDASAGGRR